MIPASWNCKVISSFFILLPLLTIASGTAPLIESRRLPASPAGQVPLGLGAVQQARLVADDVRPLDEFGWTVAISGNTAVVGARNADPDLGSGPLQNAGAAYIFVRSGDGWIQEARLVAKDANPKDTFGIAVAISGNTVVVGATGSDTGDETNAGAAYVFVREAVGWTQRAKLVASDSAEEDNFGTAVSVEGITIVVGADGKDVSGLVDCGTAYVFIRRNNSWDEKARLLPSDPQLGGYFGGAASISGDRILIGATQANPLVGAGEGAAYVFRGSGNNWIEEARLSLEDGRGGDFFGNAVALSGTTAVVGAAFRDPVIEDRRLINAGAAYVFNRVSGEWKQQADLGPSDLLPFDQFSHSLSISGDVIAVGANGKPQAGYAKAGAVYLFQRSGKEWTQGAKVVADLISEGDGFGGAVAVSGERMIVGASGRDPGAFISGGEAFIYQLLPVELPETGFAAGVVTRIGVQPPVKAYLHLGELWLEIPALDLQAPIAGVPHLGSGWDTTWLSDQVGYLEGTAFPTWPGNTAIAGHVYLPSGVPGPFFKLASLHWGDALIVHGWGQRYLYEVREVFSTSASDLSVLSHEEYDWLTLITCRDYDPLQGRYAMREVVRAVLVEIETP